MQVLQLLLCFMPESKPQGGNLDQLSEFLQLAVGIVLTEHNPVNQGIQHLLGNPGPDERPLRPPNLQNPIRNQDFDGLPHGVPAHSELFREFRLRGNLIAGTQFSQDNRIY